MKMKRTVSLLLCVALILLVLPTTTFAAKEMVQVDETKYEGLTVSGTPYSSLPVGYYTVKAEYNTDIFDN